MPPHQAPEPRPSSRKGIESRLRARVADGDTPGLQYVLVSASEVQENLAAGWAELRQRTPMRPDTTQMAYSMTKTLTAVAVLQLVDRGAVSLNDAVTAHLPTLPYGDRVTVGELVTHTGGLPNPIPLRWVHPVAAHPTFCESSALAAVLQAHGRLARDPGVRFAYSNIGYWLLGALIERVSGMPFTTYMTRHVVEPLGMPAEDLGFEIAARDRHATGYLEKWSVANLLGRWLLDPALLGPYEHGWRRVGDHYPNGPAFGGLVGSAGAFARFLQDQLQPRSVLLSDASRALLYTTQRTRSGTTIPMTFGWHVGRASDGPFYFKEGGGGGFHCLMRVYPARGLASVVMTNATGFKVTRCLDAVDPDRSGGAGT